MTIAPWRSPLSRALHRNRSVPSSRYVQLATVRPDGTPANRTIVFRGFTPEGDDLQFVSDRRSEKIAQIHHQPMGELCWYFPKTREQFRIRGPLTVITVDTPVDTLQHQRHILWQALSDNARLQFSWPFPGQPRTEASFATDCPDPIQPLPDFCGLLLKAIQIDHLELRGEPQHRWLYHHDSAEKWSRQAINP